MGGAAAATPRVTPGRLRFAIAAAVWLALATAASAEPVSAPIVGGTPTSDLPAVGALVAGTDPDFAVTECTVTLVGCQTALTAAHCVCETFGGACQGAGVPPPDLGLAYFQHAGFVPIAEIEVHPSYDFPVADVALLRFATPVTGIVPMRVNDVGRAPLGTAGTIVGFGVESVVADDSGLKRAAPVTTAPCGAGVSDDTSVCWAYSGAGGNTCSGDSGGPLVVDLGTGPVVAGVTSGGFAENCLPPDQSYDADVYVYREWIAATAAGDLGTNDCGGVPAVGTLGAFTTAFTGELGPARPFSLQSVGVAPGTTELRVALHGVEKASTDFDLYVRGGKAPAPGTFDCSATGTNQYGFCRVANPTPGSWYVRAERVKGDGLFQMVATTFGGEPAACGNGIREPGESCDGADTGTCSTGCEPTCDCVACSSTDLDVRQINLAPGLYVRGTLGDANGTYTALDPATAGVTISFTDGAGTVTIEIPPRDPGWVLVNPRRGRYRWRGERGGHVRRLAFRVRPRRPTEWLVTLKGRNVPGADTLDYDTLTARLQLGDRCAERRFHIEREPPLGR